MKRLASNRNGINGMLSNMDVINKYFFSETKFVNFLLKVSLVLVFAQQIYFPQKMKYMHLAVLFVYMIFLEFFDDAYRHLYKDYALVFMVLGCSTISILDTFVSIDLSFFYLLFLLAAIYFAFLLVYRIFTIVRLNNDFHVFTQANQIMLKKGTLFIKGLTLSIMTILLLACVYIFLQLIYL